MSIQSRACNGCDYAFDILNHNRETVHVDTGCPYDGECPECGSGDVRNIITSGVGIELGGEAGYGKIFPYFDRSLCCRVSSAKHRRQIMKARGLQPLDGDHDFARDAERDRDKRKDAIKRYAALKNRYDTDPEFADHRRLRDKGWYRDRADKARNGG